MEAGSTPSKRRMKRLTDRLKRVEEGTGNKARIQQLKSQITGVEKRVTKQQAKSESKAGYGFDEKAYNKGIRKQEREMNKAQKQTDKEVAAAINPSKKKTRKKTYKPKYTEKEINTVKNISNKRSGM